MKLVPLAGLLCVALAACASASKPAPTTATTTTTTSAETLSSASAKADESGQSAAEAWAERKIAAESETTKKESSAARLDESDPLAMGSELEESSIPKVEITPASQVRAKGPGELNAALGVLKSESTTDGAAKKLTQRLGNPSWTEAPKGSEHAKRRVWVAPAGGNCHRLVLEADGSVEVESVSKSEWRMLTASARQNACTGEIKRGITAK